MNSITKKKKTSQFDSGTELTLYILARIKLFLVTVYIEKLTTYLYLLRSVVFAFKQLENISSFDKTNFILKFPVVFYIRLHVSVNAHNYHILSWNIIIFSILYLFFHNGQNNVTNII